MTAPGSRPDALDPYLDGLVLVHPDLGDLDLPHAVRLGDAVPPEEPGKPRPCVLLAVPDVLALREAAGLADEAGVAGAPVLHDVGRARRVVVWLASGQLTPRLLPRPGWPALTGVRARRLLDGSWLAVLRFQGPAPVAAVIGELARQAVWRDTGGNDGLWIEGSASRSAAGARPTLDLDFRLSGDLATADPVTGRAPAALDPRDEPVGPLDERVLNPCGFGPASAPTLDLPALSLGDGLVRRLRPAAAVRVTWTDDPGLPRTVAGLALAGVPLVSGPVPTVAALALGVEVTAALESPFDPDDDQAREEHSLVLRRAAFDTHSTHAWRRRTAARHGVRTTGEPAVSVLLATRRPEMLDFAVRQVARQRGVEVELVLATHGFEADGARVRELLGTHRLVLRPQADDTLFGDVLGAAAAAASGDVLLKMDDDDWYAPDVVADLLRARAYSGAEVVGMPAEYHYLAEPDVTVRRGHTSETYARFVAGGTLMIDRAMLRAAGGFRPVHRFVDAQLLHAVAAAGGSVYRTHGLGYVLRRNATGHTWQVDLDYLLDPARTAERREGFAPGRLLEVAEEDRP